MGLMDRPVIAERAQNTRERKNQRSGVPPLNSMVMWMALREFLNRNLLVAMSVAIAWKDSHLRKTVEAIRKRGGEKVRGRKERVQETGGTGERGVKDLKREEQSQKREALHETVQKNAVQKNEQQEMGPKKG